MIRVHAFAKLNLSLAVIGTRPDGFHAIDSLVQTIDLCDEITVDLGGGRLTIENDLPDLKGGDLAAVAAEALLRAKNAVDGVTIRVRKRIPAGAGLGGGSSDAAAVLVTLNRLLDPTLDDAEMARVAAGIGSDVPLFLRGGLLRVSGRGERIEAVGPPVRERFLVVIPPVHCDTGEVYRRFDAGGHLPSERAGPGENALLRPALELHPALARYDRAVRDSGADYAGMSGSGAAFFAAFSDVRTMERAAEEMAREIPEAMLFRCSPTDAGQRVIEGAST
jgi:4-diphosphocytidyl-2-C-methyl-D-erythritol kinase